MASQHKNKRKEVLNMRYIYEIETKSGLSIKKTGKYMEYVNTLKSLQEKGERFYHVCAEPIVPSRPIAREQYLVDEMFNLIQSASLEEVYHAIAWYTDKIWIASPVKNPLTCQLDEIEWKTNGSHSFFKRSTLKLLRTRRRSLLK